MSDGSHPNLNGHSPLHARGGPHHSQASGQAEGYKAPGAPGGPTDRAGRAIKKKAKSIGNALLPGNPF